MLDTENNYIIEDYQKKSIFYSFLPGISGMHGIPLWCHYTNRGQCITSFGVQDKDHSIMEFYPAHQAVERVPLLGFRTFLKVDGVYQEAFSAYEVPKKMIIGMNHLEIQEDLNDLGITIKVEYVSLPEEPLAGLMRRVTIGNTGHKTVNLELADGMAELLPYGVTAESMKEMGQTSKAWMQVIGQETGLPTYRVRASMEDSAQVTDVKGVHFAFAREKNGPRLPVIVDREVMFEADSALISPHGFIKRKQKELLEQPQTTCNDVSCCFFLSSKMLDCGESLTIEELYGMTESVDLLTSLEKASRAQGWYDKKRQLADSLAEKITSRIATKTGNPVFDAYCRQTFLDNLLRGGYPVLIGKQVLYLYSRKHGDMERDYNYFSMLPEYYSQGNGNFRDVNQNRRCDVQFSPFVDDRNLKMFYNALQINGYNPLGIEKVTFSMLPEGKQFLKTLPDRQQKALEPLTDQEYSPGELYAALEHTGLPKDQCIQLFEKFLQTSEPNNTTKFIEGYWTDHWTYNLDLIESYLAVYPEKEKNLLFEDSSYLFRQAEAQILPRRKRYKETENGLRQYEFLKKTVDTSEPEKRYLKDQEGNVIRVNLLEKLFSLCTVKMAALDPYGMGIEMEGGKPGWYDALNGLPGLLGSSMAEACELERLLEYLKQHLQQYVQEDAQTVSVLTEIARLAEEIIRASSQWKQELETSQSVIHYWNQVNDAKEQFWEETAFQVKGTREMWSISQLWEVLNIYQWILKQGLKKSEQLEHSVPATYYYYQVDRYEKQENGILPLEFTQKKTPDFLEGTVHSLKLSKTLEQKKKIYSQVKQSKLFDRKLQMYKVNASLSDASFELGRSCAFTPGWLENESVWLHMEYKYLLELLKSGLYEEFIQDFHKMAVPFLKEETYGRSPLENSSFIASSVNPNEKNHGKGFVARLSGSTAEFLQMWQIMMFGAQPFTVEDQILKLRLHPMIPSWLIGEEQKIEAAFLGSISVVYQLPDREHLIPGNYAVKKYKILWKNGNEETAENIEGTTAEAIRSEQAEKITVQIERSIQS